MIAKEKQSFDILPYNTKVELIAIDKETGQAYKKIIEIQEYKNIKRKSSFNYLPPYQLGFSQFKDVKEI